MGSFLIAPLAQLALSTAFALLALQTPPVHGRGLIYKTEASIFVPSPFEYFCETHGGDFYQCDDLDADALSEFYKTYVTPNQFANRPDRCDLMTQQTPIPIFLFDELFLTLFANHCRKINTSPVNDYNVYEIFASFANSVRTCSDQTTNQWHKGVQFTEHLQPTHYTLMTFPAKCGGYQVRLMPYTWTPKEILQLTDYAYEQALIYKQTMWYDIVQHHETFADYAMAPFIFALIETFYRQPQPLNTTSQTVRPPLPKP